MTRVKKNQVSILLTALVLGLLIAMQARSFESVSDIYSRETRSDVFREIQILKSTNEGLTGQVVELEDQLERFSNNQDALEGVREEIAKYEALSGEVKISGPGIRVNIRGDLKALWLTDMVNELLEAGAEAITVNGIRLTNRTVGFDEIPSGQILLNSVILPTPYVIEAIGERSVLDESLTQPQGILERMEQNVPDVAVTIEERDLIEMAKVL